MRRFVSSLGITSVCCRAILVPHVLRKSWQRNGLGAFHGKIFADGLQSATLDPLRGGIDD